MFYLARHILLQISRTGAWRSDKAQKRPIDDAVAFDCELAPGRDIPFAEGNNRLFTPLAITKHCLVLHAQLILALSDNTNGEE